MRARTPSGGRFAKGWRALGKNNNEDKRHIVCHCGKSLPCPQHTGEEGEQLDDHIPYDQFYNEGNRDN